MMPTFNLRDRVRRIGEPDVWTVEQIREVPGVETKYWIQLGSDFKTRVWVNQSEVKLAPNENPVMAVAYDYEAEKHIREKK